MLIFCENIITYTSKQVPKKQISSVSLLKMVFNS